MFDTITNLFPATISLFSSLEYTKLIPLLILLVVGYFLIKGLEEIFKIIFYIFAVAVLIYFFKDVLLYFF